MPAQHVNTQQFQDLFQEAKYVLADFHAEWCPPCKMMSPIIDNFSQDEDLKEITFVKVDTDQESQLAEEFGITTIPTFVLLKTLEGGKYEEITRYKGGQEPLSFKMKLQQAITA
jgi:thioredoxin 1